jgi:hypothetical protein
MNSLENDPIRNLPLVTEPRDTKRPAATWQIVLTAFGLIAIVTVFLWGINNQRDETAGQQTAATMPSTVSPQGGAEQNQNQQQAGQPPQQSKPSTTGQGGGDQNGRQPNGGQTTNGQPAGSNGKPTQDQSK